MAECWIDYRETVLVSQVEGSEAKNLELGDVQLVLDGDPKIIIERKTISDLAQSVKDNRYKEQKARLLSYKHEHSHVKIIYVLEGFFTFDPNNMYSGMSNNVITSCIINTMLRDGFFVIFTKNIKDTCQFISALKKRFEGDPGKYISSSPWVPSHDTYTSCIASSVKTKKKENIDEQACFIMQLCCVPGISAKKANDLCERLGVKNVSEFTKKISEQGVEALLKVPGIGKVLANTIHKYLVGVSE